MHFECTNIIFATMTMRNIVNHIKYKTAYILSTIAKISLMTQTGLDVYLCSLVMPLGVTFGYTNKFKSKYIIGLYFCKYTSYKYNALLAFIRLSTSGYISKVVKPLTLST